MTDCTRVVLLVELAADDGNTVRESAVLSKTTPEGENETSC